jgi:hypothetical protein
MKNWLGCAFAPRQEGLKNEKSKAGSRQPG